jgi:excisionase family DNA binding protein
MTQSKISVAEAARRLGVALTYVYSLVWAGKLPGQKVNGRWKISEIAVENRLKAKLGNDR